jgi:hypothetical protein
MHPPCFPQPFRDFVNPAYTVRFEFVKLIGVFGVEYPFLTGRESEYIRIDMPKFTVSQIREAVAVAVEKLTAGYRILFASVVGFENMVDCVNHSPFSMQTGQICCHSSYFPLRTFHPFSLISRIMLSKNSVSTSS